MRHTRVKVRHLISSRIDIIFRIQFMRFHVYYDELFIDTVDKYRDDL